MNTGSGVEMWRQASTDELYDDSHTMHCLLLYIAVQFYGTAEGTPRCEIPPVSLELIHWFPFHRADKRSRISPTKGGVYGYRQERLQNQEIESLKAVRPASFASAVLDIGNRY